MRKRFIAAAAVKIMFDRLNECAARPLVARALLLQTRAYWYIIVAMTNAFAYPCQKVLKKYGVDSEIAPIIKDIENAKQGVTTFSKEVKKYMLSFIHAHYDDNEEVKELIGVLKNSGRYQSFSELEIFRLQDECYFWYDFLSAYGVWKIIGKTIGYDSAEHALNTLVRLIRLDEKTFTDFGLI